MKELRNWGYLLSFIPGAAAIFGNLNGSWYTLTCAVLVLIILGGIEWLSVQVKSNRHTPAADPFPEMIIYGLAVMHTMVWMSLAWGIYHETLQGAWIYCAAFSSGIAAGAGGIVPAHELVHKANPVKRWVGKYMLTSCGNIYFYVHHLRIHHRLVGTGKDAATARYNESLYAFYLRTIAGQIAEAWESEATLLAKQGKGSVNFSNQLLRNIIWQLMTGIAVFVLLSWQGLAAWLIFIGMANLLLEYVNYIEHYGLSRDESEKVSEMHSWNSDGLLSRFLLVDLSRHADHHSYPARPYHMLNTHHNAPQLPGGYAGLFLPALIPPLWKAIVHPRIPEKKIVGAD